MITVCGEMVAREALPVEVERIPRAGKRWVGVPHRHLAEAIVKAVVARGLEILGEKWALEAKGQKMVGGITVGVPGLDPIEGMQYDIAVRHANDLSTSMRVSTGAHVMVCNNGVQTGEFVLNRKHTSGFDLDYEISLAVDKAIKNLSNVAGVVNTLKEIHLTQRDEDHVFMEIGRTDVLPWSGVGKAYDLYKNPEHDEFKPYTRKGWGVYQAVNHVVKVRSPSTQLSSLGKLTDILVPAA